jgi:hypothetical protein
MSKQSNVSSLEIVRKCSNCHSTPTETMKICSGCKNFHYCSPNCQIDDWGNHKAICKKIIEQRNKIINLTTVLEQNSRKNIKTNPTTGNPLEPLKYLIYGFGDVPNMYTTMKKSDFIRLLDQDSKIDDKLTAFMNSIFQLSIIGERVIVEKIKMSIVNCGMGVSSEFQKKNFPNLKKRMSQFIRNLVDISLFFENRSFHYDFVMRNFTYWCETLREKSDLMFQVTFDLLKDVEFTTTRGGEVVGNLLRAFEHRKKIHVVWDYCLTVLENLQDYDVAYITTIIQVFFHTKSLHPHHLKLIKHAFDCNYVNSQIFPAFEENYVILLSTIMLVGKLQKK